MIPVGIGDVSEQKARSNTDQNNVHQTIFGAVYLNDIALATLPESRPLNYPEGAVIVREKLKTEASAPEVLTAMIKRKKGFNPEANDWEFLLISGDATKIKKREKTGGCLGCHESVAPKDFIFDNYLPVGEPEAMLGTRSVKRESLSAVLSGWNFNWNEQRAEISSYAR